MPAKNQDDTLDSPRDSVFEGAIGNGESIDKDPTEYDTPESHQKRVPKRIIGNGKGKSEDPAKNKIPKSLPKGILIKQKAKGKACLHQPHLIAYDEDEAPLPKPFDIDPEDLYNDGFEEGSRVKNFFGEDHDIRSGYAELFANVPIFKPKPRPKASTSGWARLFRYDPFLSLLFSSIQEAGINIPPPDGLLDECIGYEVDYIRLAYTPYQQPHPFGKTFGLRPHPAPVRKGTYGTYWYGIPTKEEEKEFPEKSKRLGNSGSDMANSYQEAPRSPSAINAPKGRNGNISEGTEPSGEKDESPKRVAFADQPEDDSKDWDSSTIGNDEISDQVDDAQQQTLDPDLPVYGPLNFKENLQAYLKRRREQDEAFEKRREEQLRERREYAARMDMPLIGPGPHPNMISIDKMVRIVKREEKLYYRAYQKMRKILRIIWDGLK
ncbi:hypothetical protein RRF57_005535 [Xylaria bambusicola]|uniref:Uncharacterized protein n=1 Tax=Xylaria bambusicola TaxID=326684 RepID=A0AAN7UCS3_9PEZI